MCLEKLTRRFAATLAAEVVEEDMVMVAEEEEEDMVTVEEVVDLMAVDMVNKLKDFET